MPCKKCSNSDGPKLPYMPLCLSYQPSRSKHIYVNQTNHQIKRNNTTIALSLSLSLSHPLSLSLTLFKIDPSAYPYSVYFFMFFFVLVGRLRQNKAKSPAPEQGPAPYCPPTPLFFIFTCWGRDRSACMPKHHATGWCNKKMICAFYRRLVPCQGQGQGENPHKGRKGQIDSFR